MISMQHVIERIGFTTPEGGPGLALLGKLEGTADVWLAEGL